MGNCPTPHINAHPGDFAHTVLMPGDPLRSRFVAENFLFSIDQVSRESKTRKLPPALSTTASVAYNPIDFCDCRIFFD